MKGAVVRPRPTELGLILLAGLVTAGAYTLVSLARVAKLPANLVPLAAVIIGLLGVAHLGVRRFAPSADPVLLPVAGVLNGIGYVFITRLDHHLAGLQAVWTALGVLAFIGTLAIVKRTTDLERYRYTFALLGIGLLLMPLLPVVGRNINGARLWVRVGTITFQPGELAKIALAIFFASYLIDKQGVLSDFGRGRIPSARVLGPIVLAWGASLLVMTAEKDLGSSLLFFTIFIVMLWVATNKTAYLGIGAGLFAFGAVTAYKIFSHVQERVHVWRNPWPDAAGKGYQVVQGLFAIGTGGLAGTGLALGSPQRIPAATTDFIFAAIGEELGLLGTVAIVAAFLLMVGAGLRIALRAERPFEQLLATGLTVIIGVQSFIIIGGVVRLIPLTGVTLPFVSYGGSSLVANYILLALLLRISDANSARARDASLLARPAAQDAA
jgi:peptidoglycan glycosyltransferase